MQTNRWNEKFSKEGFMYGIHPNEFIKNNIHLIPKKSRILCLAEGEGRNAIYLASLGYEIEALDASDVGLDKLNKRAKEEKLSIKTTLIDLEDWKPTEDFDAIVASFMHLPEPLRSKAFKTAIGALKPQGYMIMEFFSKDQMREGFTSGGPKDLDLLYDVESLKPCFEDQAVDIIQLNQEEDVLDEGWGHQGPASLIRVILQKKE